MRDRERDELARLVLAPYVQKATALMGHYRAVGGNQFRHAMATLAILIDYGLIVPVLLKASVIHDLFEDVPDTDRKSIEVLDGDGPAVVRLVAEVTRGAETKPVFLERLRSAGSHNAKLLKVADRISNLTDLHHSIFSDAFVQRYLDETERYVHPMALEVNKNMALEIEDLIARRRGMRVTAS